MTWEGTFVLNNSATQWLNNGSEPINYELEGGQKEQWNFGTGNDNTAGKKAYYVAMVTVPWRSVRVWTGTETWALLPVTTSPRFHKKKELDFIKMKKKINFSFILNVVQHLSIKLLKVK